MTARSADFFAAPRVAAFGAFVDGSDGGFPGVAACFLAAAFFFPDDGFDGWAARAMVAPVRW